jgi:hypothetical protein
VKYEFQVLYQMTASTGTIGQRAVGEVIVAGGLIAEGADQLEAQFKGAGFHVVAVNAVRAVVDWDKPNFDRDEAGAYLTIKGSTFSANKGNGEIPWVEMGNGFVPRRWLDALIEKKANRAGKEIAEELKKAA